MDNETTVRSAEESLFDALASDPEFAGEEEAVEEQESPESDEADDLEEEDSEEEAEEFDEDDESEEEEEETQTYTVKAGGEEVSVTLDELLAGYSRTSDYTRKTQEVAQQRKAVEGETAAYREAREQYAERLEVVGRALESLQPREPDWDTLRQQNPAEYAAQRADWQRRQEQVHAVESERQRVARERAEDQQRQIQDVLNRERAQLVEALPEWKDAERQEADKSRLVNYAKTAYGYSDDDLGQVYDHRVMLILRKAMQFDELQTKGREGLREKKRSAKTLKPGPRAATQARGPKKQARALRDRLATSGRDRDAAALIEHLLPDD